MPLDLTYGVFAGLVGASLLFLPPTEPMRAGDPPRGAVAFSLGPEVDARGGRRLSQNFATLEYLPESRAPFGTRPVYAAALSSDGAGFVSAGLRHDYRLGPLQVTPHFSVAAWHSGQHGFETRELLQFRTGLDLYLSVTENTAVGLGFYHLSNGQLTRSITPFSADVDVVRIGLLHRF